MRAHERTADPPRRAPSARRARAACRARPASSRARQRSSASRRVRAPGRLSISRAVAPMGPAEVRRSMATRTRFWLGLLALASLTHCAGNPTALTHDAALAPGEGVVLLRVVGNASEPWSQLELAPDTGGTPQTVFAADFAENSSGVFVGKLPAGRYRPVQMKAALQTGNLVTTLEVPLEARLGRFAVEAGRVTNLGTVVYQEYGAMVKMHIKNAVVRSPAPAPSAALLHSQFPAVAAAVEGKPELGWDDPVRAPSPQLVQVL